MSHDASRREITPEAFALVFGQAIVDAMDPATRFYTDDAGSMWAEDPKAPPVVMRIVGTIDINGPGPW